jgi:hypothetical protein
LVGNQQHLSPKALVASALFESVSLILFIVFEIWQTMVVSHLSIKFALAVNEPAADVAKAIETYKRMSRDLMKPLHATWKVLFPSCALTGLAGGGILIAAFVASLWKMYSF